MEESETPMRVAFSWTERHFCLLKVITYVIRSDCQSLYRRIYERACLAPLLDILRKDDSPGRRRGHNANALADALRSEGHKVIQAADGNKALAFTSEIALRLGYHRPFYTNQSGFVLVTSIRVMWPHMPILLISGHLSPEVGKLVSKGVYAIYSEADRSGGVSRVC
jgi:hypothetical protein